jgi:hypothetical protein
MISFELALIQHDWCSYKKGKFRCRNRYRDRQAQQEDTWEEDNHVTRMTYLQARKPQKVEARKSSPLAFKGRKALPTNF